MWLENRRETEKDEEMLKSDTSSAKYCYQVYYIILQWFLRLKHIRAGLQTDFKILGEFSSVVTSSQPQGVITNKSILCSTRSTPSTGKEPVPIVKTSWSRGANLRWQLLQVQRRSDVSLAKVAVHDS